MSTTKIEWADRVWNPVTGCPPDGAQTEGCRNCYARRMANRLRGRCGYKKDDPFAITLRDYRLDEPYRRRKPSRVFVCSMGDLFHGQVPWQRQVWRHGPRETWIILQVIRECPQHTFLLLTKRPCRMRLILGEYYHSIGIEHLPNVWCGVSVHDNDAACSLIPLLLEVPAAVRFLSVEPMLGPVDLRPWLGRIDWVICGPETGPGARPFDPAWAKAFYGQCREAGVPFFLKRRTIDGREVREFPRGGK